MLEAAGHTVRGHALTSRPGAGLRYTAPIVNSGVAAMRTWTLPIMMLMLALVVSGCGQKGPLYRDSQAASVTSGTDSAQDRQDPEENRD